MKIKRTVAPSVREAMKKVREEQGPDAVILANRKIRGGVEIISATDYDETAFDTPAEKEPVVQREEPPRLRQTVSRQRKPQRELVTDIDDEPAVELSYASVARATSQTAKPARSRQQAAAVEQVAPPRNVRSNVKPRQHEQTAFVDDDTELRAAVAEMTRPARAAAAFEPPTAKPVPVEPPVVAEAAPVAPVVTVAEPAPIPAVEPAPAPAPVPATPAPTAPAVAEVKSAAPIESPALPRTPPPMVDISAVPTAQSSQPPAAGYETDSNSWQQGQLIHDLQRELHSLRGLMQNQFSVLEWDSMAKRNPVQFDLLSRLSEMGLGADIARTLVSELDACSDPEKMWRLALAHLAGKIPIADDDLLDTGGIVAVVGPTGVGKTTTVAKLAARFVMRHGQRSVGLISTDGYRIGAHEQLQHYARILGVPFKTANNQDELGRALGSFFDKKLVLIDTAGMSQRDIRLSEQISTLRDSFSVIRTYLVLAANTQLGALDEAAKGFGRADLSACVVTKLDETTSVGAAITVAMRHHLPIAYLGVGQRVPEDLQPARAHRLVSRAVPMADRYGEQIDPDTLAVRFGGGAMHAGV